MNSRIKISLDDCETIGVMRDEEKTAVYEPQPEVVEHKMSRELIKRCENALCFGSISCFESGIDDTTWISIECSRRNCNLANPITLKYLVRDAVQTELQASRARHATNRFGVSNRNLQPVNSGEITKLKLVKNDDIVG